MTIWKSVDVESLLPGLRRYARALTRDASAADDLVQDTLVRAYEKADSYSAGRPLRTWLFAILYRQYVDGLRREASQRKRDARIADGASPSTMGSDDPEQAIYLREIAARFAALPDPQRAALHLIAVEGLSYQDAANALDVPIGTVMSRLSRARAALRRQEDGVSDINPMRIVGGKDAS